VKTKNVQGLCCDTVRKISVYRNSAEAGSYGYYREPVNVKWRIKTIGAWVSRSYNMKLFPSAVLQMCTVPAILQLLITIIILI